MYPGPDADRRYPDADRRCLIYKVGAESGAASHAPPSQLSPGGDRADIWGEGERKRFSVQLGALKREEGEKKRRDRLCEISSPTLSSEDAWSGEGCCRWETNAAHGKHDDDSDQ